MNTTTEKFKTWITADLHLSHQNIMKFNPDTRQHSDVTDMNESIVRRWNEDVMLYDLVYILGDVAFCNAEKAVAYLNRMNGRKILVAGNHDVKLLKDQSFRDCFAEIHQYLEVDFAVDDVKAKVVMFHFPIFDHNGAGRGSIMLHGHRHGNPHNLPGRIMDVGLDATGLVVSELSKVIRYLMKIPHMYHHLPRT